MFIPSKFSIPILAIGLGLAGLGLAKDHFYPQEPPRDPLTQNFYSDNVIKGVPYYLLPYGGGCQVVAEIPAGGVIIETRPDGSEWELNFPGPENYS